MGERRGQTIAEMRAYADAEGIDLGTATLKADIDRTIMRALADRAVAVAREGEAEPEPVVAQAPPPPAHEGDPRVDAAMDQWRNREPEPDTDVLDAAHERAALVPVMPTFAQWQQIETMGDSLAGSQLVRAKKLNTAADVKLILLAARDLGVPPTMAIQQIHVIDGKPSLSAQLMVALVRNAGHSITPEVMTAERAVAVGRRGDEMVTFEFTIEEARAAGLANKDNWKHYPKAMLWARAVSGLCRILFPDVLAGLTYTPEELAGDEADAWTADVPPPVRVASVQGPAVREGDDVRLDELDKAQYRAKFMAWGTEVENRIRADVAVLQRERRLSRWSELRAADRPVLDELVARYLDELGAPTPPCDDDQAEAAPDAEPTDDEVAREYARQLRERNTGAPETVVSPALNDVTDAVVVCGSCGRPNTDHVEGCSEEPF